MNKPFLPADRARTAGRPAQYFERAVYAQALAGLSPGGQSLEEIVKKRWGDDAATLQLVTRAAVSPASRGTPAWAGNLALDAVGDFVASLAPQSAAARLISAGLKVSLAGKNSVKIPRRNAAPATNIPWVPESGAIPIKTYSLDAATLGPACKFAAGAVMTREVTVHSSGQETISTLLREDLAAALDAVVFGNAAAVAGTNPAGLTNGLTGNYAITGTTGGDDEAMKKDLGKLAGAIADGGGSSVVYVMSTRQALAAKLRLLAQDITIWPSVALSAGTVIGICPDAFCSWINPVFTSAPMAPSIWQTRRPSLSLLAARWPRPSKVYSRPISSPSARFLKSLFVCARRTWLPCAPLRLGEPRRDPRRARSMGRAIAGRKRRDACRHCRARAAHA